MITRMAGGPGTSDPGRFSAINAELGVLVIRAYGLQYGQIRGPAWMDKAQFDVVANVPPGTTTEHFQKMLQNLLAQRFRMQVHYETQEISIYELTVAKNGLKLKLAAEGSGTDDFVPGSGPRRADRDNFPILPPGRATGLAGQYDFTLYCRSMGGLPPGPEDDAPSIELALQEQLGLKLALSKASVDVLVIDNSEKMPTEN